MSRFITKAGFFVFMFLLMNTLVLAQNPVTFSVDMTIQTALGNFDAATDSVVIRGDFQVDAGDTGNWGGGMFKMADGDADGIYDLVVVFDDSSVGKAFEYKFAVPGGNADGSDNWESTANRPLTLVTGGSVLATVFFNDMSTTGATATITFQADMSDLINGGFFDVANDTLYAPGAHNGWPGAPAAAADIAQPALTPPTLFVLESEVTAEIGSMVAWKWRTLPATKFGNTGWETGDNHEFEFTGQNIVLDPFKPAIGPAGTPLTNDVTVQFSVDINNATDTYNNAPFGEVTGVFLQGEVDPIGGWACNWSNDDTGCFQPLSDDGTTGGDAVAGDGIWTAQVLFPAGTPNLSEYKYGIVAAGSDTLNGGVNHLDNEAGFAQNHQTPFIADQAGTFVLDTDIWGSQRPSTSVDVTFSVDMSIQTGLGNFDAATDMVVVRGSFQEDAGDAGGNWQGAMFELADGDADGIFDLVVTFDDTSAGKSFEYKFVIPGGNSDGSDNWESVDNRMFTLSSNGNVLDTVFFNDMATAGATATITFQADMSDLINGGFFDVANDTLYAPGAHNGWPGAPGSAADIAQPALTPPTLFVLESEVTAEIGSEIGWKWRTLPATKFANTGWEGGDNHMFTFTGQDLVLDPFKPDIGPAGTPLTNDVTVQFSVDINGATDTYNNLPFGEVSGVFLQGEVDPIGGWACNWSNDDTGCFQALSDDGTTGGDAVAGDGIWTVQVLFPAGTPNLSEYKYGIVAAGSDTLNGGVNHLDNEAGFAQNHQTPFIADQAGTFVLDTDIWGSQKPVSVESRGDGLVPEKYALNQNYPNPFNPTTQISYDLPDAGRVTLKIYNSIGQEIVTLVNEEQSPGAYVVRWNGANMASGLYFYKLESGSFSVTKKMLLMK